MGEEQSQPMGRAAAIPKPESLPVLPARRGSCWSLDSPGCDKSINPALALHKSGMLEFLHGMSFGSLLGGLWSLLVPRLRQLPVVPGGPR